jgi:hypothetical protein
MKTFKEFIFEVNIASSGGVYGSGQDLGVGSLVGNSDSYATGDSRIPYVIGTFRRAGIAKGKKKNKLKRALKRKSKRK